MGNIPLWLCIPFAGLLLCIAIFPLVKGEWWDKNKGWAVLIWSLLFMIPFAVKYGAGETAETVLECIVNDYLSFIVLLFGLFCVSGNINLEGDFVGSPRMNTGLLAIGTLLSSCIGTTGASMLLVRPMIQMNSWRRNKSHIMVFFIFLISNMGGCLTPIGDPPLNTTPATIIIIKIILCRPFTFNVVVGLEISGRMPSAISLRYARRSMK